MSSWADRSTPWIRMLEVPRPRDFHTCFYEFTFSPAIKGSLALDLPRNRPESVMYALYAISAKSIVACRIARVLMVPRDTVRTETSGRLLKLHNTSFFRKETKSKEGVPMVGFAEVLLDNE